MSKDCRAGVERPDAVIEGWRLRFLGSPAAAARSAEAWDTPPTGMVVVLPACVWVEVFVVPLPVAETDVEGVVAFCALLVLSELEDLCLREGVGCVAPVIWCVGLGSDISTGSSEADVEVEECEALEATDAVCALRAVSSRVRRLTCRSH